MTANLLVGLSFIAAAAWLTFWGLNPANRNRVRWGRFGKGPRMSVFSIIVWDALLLGVGATALLYHLDMSPPATVLKSLFIAAFILVAIGWFRDTASRAKSDQD